MDGIGLPGCSVFGIQIRRLVCVCVREFLYGGGSHRGASHHAEAFHDDEWIGSVAQSRESSSVFPWAVVCDSLPDGDGRFADFYLPAYSAISKTRGGCLTTSAICVATNAGRRSLSSVISKMNLFNRFRARFGRRHQKAEPQPAIAGGPSVWETHSGHSAPRPQRDEYKATWTELSQTIEQAKQFVLNIQDEEQIRVEAEVTRRVLEATVGVKPEDYILEIGCGFGRVGAELAPRCARWVGCDVSPHMVAYARERLSVFDNVEVKEISGFDLQPVPDESVDVVYCTVVFMHLDEWDRYKYVLEARRVLRPGGRVYIDNFSLCSEGGWKVFEHHREIPPHERPPHMSKSSTPQELETYLKRAGFRDIELEEDERWVRAYAIK